MNAAQRLAQNVADERQEQAKRSAYANLLASHAPRLRNALLRLSERYAKDVDDTMHIDEFIRAISLLEETEPPADLVAIEQPDVEF